jgi:hypothetical protein
MQEGSRRELCIDDQIIREPKYGWLKSSARAVKTSKTHQIRLATIRSNLGSTVSVFHLSQALGAKVGSKPRKLLSADYAPREERKRGRQSDRKFLW